MPELIPGYLAQTDSVSFSYLVPPSNKEKDTKENKPTNKDPWVCPGYDSLVKENK